MCEIGCAIIAQKDCLLFQKGPNFNNTTNKQSRNAPNNVRDSRFVVYVVSIGPRLKLYKSLVSRTFSIIQIKCKDEKVQKSNPKFIAGEAYLFRCHHKPTIIGIFDK